MKRAASAVQLPTTAGGAITSAGPGAGAGEQVRQHRRRLAETHVEREAAAEAGLVEEAEPGERFRLVAAQLADEAVGHAGRRRRDVGRRREQIGRPTAADDVDATAQRRTFDAEREAQHRGARELGGVGALGQRFGRGREVGAVDRDPALAGTDERARFLGQPRDVGGGELDIVEHRRPAHVRELVRADHRLRRRVDEHAQRRRRLAPRQRGHAHVEAGRDELRTGDGHQLPRFVLAQDDLAAPDAAGSRQRGQHALEARGLVFEPGAARARVRRSRARSARARPSGPTRTPRGARRCRRREDRGARPAVRARR